MPSRPDILADRLAKRYGEVVAVRDVSFEVPPGQIFGFLGPNGAGKSTVVQILTTLALPSDGRAEVGGYDVIERPAEVRRVSGVALQEVGLDPQMTGRQLLRLHAGLFGFSRGEAARRADELLEIVGLTGDADRRAGQYSGGMRRRLDLAMALVHEPRILFLDEPTTGLDPASRRDVWEEVRRLNREAGMTIFLTTQYLEEADTLAGRIAIVDHGTIVRAGTPDELKSAMGEESIELTFDAPERAERAQKLLETLEVVPRRPRRDGASLRLYVDRAAQKVAPVATALADAGLEPASLTVARPTLDDVFLAATGQRYDPAGEEVTDDGAAGDAARPKAGSRHEPGDAA
jgi:ABC-2 type transport system ATP-binding protein